MTHRVKLFNQIPLPLRPQWWPFASHHQPLNVFLGTSCPLLSVQLGGNLIRQSYSIELDEAYQEAGSGFLRLPHLYMSLWQTDVLNERCRVSEARESDIRRSGFLQKLMLLKKALSFFVARILTAFLLFCGCCCPPSNPRHYFYHQHSGWWPSFLLQVNICGGAH